MRNIYTYIISDRINTARSEQNFQVDNARIVILPAKGRINEGSNAEKTGEPHVKIIVRTEKKPKLILAAPGAIYSINASGAISQNGDMADISQNTRTIHTNNQQAFTNTVFQSTLLLFNSVLIIFTLIHR